MEPITVKYKVLDARAKVPAYATPGAAAADLCAVLDAPLTVAPMQRVLVPTGLAIELPGAHSVALVYARSGLSIKHGLCMANGVGVVDSDYRGELKVPMVNLGAEAYTSQPGERVAQLCIAPVYTAAFVPAEELGDTQRGVGGFGLNITNNVAAQFYAEQGLSSLLILPEVKDSDIATIAPTRNGKPVPTGVMIYGHMPLMLTRACPLQNIHDCAHCDKTGVLTDRKAKKFPVRCGLGVRTIYNPVPIYMGDKPGALAVDYGVAYFTLESREEAAQILDSIRTHAPFEGDFTRGLYFKGTN